MGGTRGDVLDYLGSFGEPRGLRVLGIELDGTVGRRG